PGAGRGVQGRVRRVGEPLVGDPLVGGALDAGEHHVPDPAGPAADGAVPDVPLLLRVRSHRAVDAAVGDVPAAGPAVAVRRQVEPAAYVHAPERGGLGDGPAIGAADRDDGQVLRRTPEVLRGVAVEPARVDRDVTVEGGVV